MCETHNISREDVANSLGIDQAVYQIFEEAVDNIAVDKAKLFIEKMNIQNDLFPEKENIVEAHHSPIGHVGKSVGGTYYTNNAVDHKTTELALKTISECNTMIANQNLLIEELYKKLKAL